MLAKMRSVAMLAKMRKINFLIVMRYFAFAGNRVFDKFIFFFWKESSQISAWHHSIFSYSQQQIKFILSRSTFACTTPWRLIGMLHSLKMASLLNILIQVLYYSLFSYSYIFSLLYKKTLTLFHFKLFCISSEMELKLRNWQEWKRSTPHLVQSTMKISHMTVHNQG